MNLENRIAIIINTSAVTRVHASSGHIALLFVIDFGHYNVEFRVWCPYLTGSRVNYYDVDVITDIFTADGSIVEVNLPVALRVDVHPENSIFALRTLI